MQQKFEYVVQCKDILNINCGVILLVTQNTGDNRVYNV